MIQRGASPVMRQGISQPGEEGCRPRSPPRRTCPNHPATGGTARCCRLETINGEAGGCVAAMAKKRPAGRPSLLHLLC